MKRMISSASRVALITLTLTACIAFLKGILPVDQFMIVIMAVYSFFFTKSVPDNKENTITTKLETTSPVTTE